MSVYLPHSLPPGQVSQLSCPGVGCFSNLPAAAASPQAGRLRGDGASPSACRPQGCVLCMDVCLAECSQLNETEMGRGGGSKASLLLQRGCVFRSRVGSSRRRAHAAPRPAHIQTHRPVGILTLDDKALFVNMLLICNFENKIETSCVLKYEMKCDALYTI